MFPELRKVLKHWSSPEVLNRRDLKHFKPGPKTFHNYWIQPTNQLLKYNLTYNFCWDHFFFHARKWDFKHKRWGTTGLVDQMSTNFPNVIVTRANIDEGQIKGRDEKGCKMGVNGRQPSTRQKSVGWSTSTKKSAVPLTVDS